VLVCFGQENKVTLSDITLKKAWNLYKNYTLDEKTKKEILSGKNNNNVSSLLGDSPILSAIDVSRGSMFLNYQYPFRHSSVLNPGSEPFPTMALMEHVD
jgi:hypothetical protein